MRLPISTVVLVLTGAIVLSSAASETRAADPPPSPVAAIEQALAAQPGDAVLAYFLAVFRAREGNVDGTLDALEQTLASGSGFMPPLDQFALLRDDQRFAVLRARFERRLPVRTDGRVAFTLPDRGMIPEGIAHDARSRSFYVGSVARNAIYRVDADGRMQRFSKPADGLDAILGLAVDADARRLYAVSTSALTAAGRAQLRNAIKVYDLQRGRLLRTIDVREARQLNDVAIVPGGTLLVTDSAGGAVWRIVVADGTVSALVPLDTARGANGIAVAPRGDVAYVAAARRPLRIDIASGAIAPLQPPAGENAAAIDGLYWHDGALIGIQNMTNPGRVVRLRLADDGRSIASVETLQSHHQRAFDEPTTAAITPDGLFVLARTQVTQFNDEGRLDRPETLANPLVLRIPLRSGARTG
jgi:sugar lactone lactonase YvrE